MSDFDTSNLHRRMDTVMESADSEDVWHGDVMDLMMDLQNDLARRLKQSVSNEDQKLASRLPDGAFYDLRVFAVPPDTSGERDSISVYVTVSRIERTAGISQPPIDISVAKLSDHCKKFDDILVWIDVDEYIKVRGNGGFSCKWNSMVLDPQKFDLMNGRPTRQSTMNPEVPDEAMIVGAEFSISEEDKKDVITRAAKGTMDNVHRKIKELVDQEWGQ